MRAPADANGRLRVEPDPAPAGGKVTIHGASGETVYVYRDGSGQEAEPVKLGPDGKVTIPVPVGGGESFTVYTDDWPASAVSVEVYDVD